MDIVFLNQQMRQLNDPIYHTLLQRIRQGLTDTTDYVKLLQELVRDPVTSSGKYIVNIRPHSMY